MGDQKCVFSRRWIHSKGIGKFCCVAARDTFYGEQLLPISHLFYSTTKDKESFCSIRNFIAIHMSSDVKKDLNQKFFPLRSLFLHAHWTIKYSFVSGNFMAEVLTEELKCCLTFEETWTFWNFVRKFYEIQKVLHEIRHPSSLPKYRSTLKLYMARQQSPRQSPVSPNRNFLWLKKSMRTLGSKYIILEVFALCRCYWKFYSKFRRCTFKKQTFRNESLPSHQPPKSYVSTSAHSISNPL